MSVKTNQLVTYDDYRRLPDDGKRYEIIQGELYMTPAPSTIHQAIVGNLYVSLRQAIQDNGLGRVFMAPTDVVLSMTNVVQPDLCVISKDRARIITRANIVEAPDLIVEVLSESTVTVDKGAKKSLYQQFGVREYWIVDPDTETVEQYVLREAVLELQGTFGRGQAVTSHVFDVPVAIDDLFRR